MSLEPPAHARPTPGGKNDGGSPLTGWLLVALMLGSLALFVWFGFVRPKPAPPATLTPTATAVVIPTFATSTPTVIVTPPVPLPTVPLPLATPVVYMPATGNGGMLCAGRC